MYATKSIEVNILPLEIWDVCHYDLFIGDNMYFDVLINVTFIKDWQRLQFNREDDDMFGRCGDS